MKTQAAMVLEEAVRDSLGNLFGHYASSPPEVCPLEERKVLPWLCEFMGEAAETEEMVSSFIGLGADQFKSSVGLLTTVKTSLALCDSFEACPADWTGELANQLMGRVKNQLSEYEVDASLSLPMSVRGIAMGFRFSKPHQKFFGVDTDQGRVICVLSVEIDPSIEWTQVADLKSASEGSLCLF